MQTSIIIPVYNAERYIQDCLLSLQRQTRAEFHVICVDDGSTDGSLEILQSFATADSRFRVLTQENSGASAARNTGFDAAATEYVTFVDADDEVAPEFVELLEDAAGSTGAQVAVANKAVVLPSRTKPKTPLLSRKTVRGSDYRRNRLLRHIAPHAKLLRRDFLTQHGIRFFEGVTYEDYIYWLECLAKDPTVATIPQVLYSYKKNPDSISSVSHRLKPFNLNSRLVQTRECLRIAEESGIEGLTKAVRATQFERSVFRHIAAMGTSRDREQLRAAHALLKEGLEPYRETLLDGDIRGWKRLAYKLILDGSTRDTVRLVRFAQGKMALRTVVHAKGLKPNLYVSRQSLPSIEGAPRHLYNVADLIR